MLQQIEVDVDIKHLRPHRGLLELRIGSPDPACGSLRCRTPTCTKQTCTASSTPSSVPTIAAVYSSADLGLTKHRGGVFAAVAERILHIGDNYQVDVRMAQHAGWHAVHLPRHRWGQVKKTVGKVLAVPTKMRSIR